MTGQTTYFESYVERLKKHNFYFRQRDDPRYWDGDRQREREIETMQPVVDPDFEVYNQYSPYKMDKKTV